ncbi:MAG TPA: M14 family zinc carboxypeptidase [Rhodocyclaceae bacterium]|nr:M14 family zinc carboxypeptidase [Rhodocyclaceae bacterium]
MLALMLIGAAQPATAAPAPIAAATPAADQGAQNALCQALGRRLKSVPATRCTGAGLKAAGGYSVQGRPLLVRDVTPKALPATASNGAITRPPRVLLIGGIHGDELASVSIVFNWLSRMDTPEGKAFQWRVIPIANPDGLLNSPARRTNANGIDLNRNFASRDWPAQAQHYWSQNTHSDPRRNPGTTAASEPETRWLQKQVEDFRPDVIVSVHAPYGVLDFDGPTRKPPEHFGRLRLNRLGIYPGSLGNYAGMDRSIPVITLEFPMAASMPKEAELNKVWGDMVQWMRNNVPPRG